MRRLSVSLAVVGLLVIGAMALMGRITTARDAGPVASPPAGCPTTTAEENAAIARGWHEDVISTHDLAVLDAILAPDAVLDSTTFADNPGSWAVLGLLTGFPDVRRTVAAVITERDLVVVRYAAAGTAYCAGPGRRAEGDTLYTSGEAQTVTNGTAPVESDRTRFTHLVLTSMSRGYPDTGRSRCITVSSAGRKPSWQ